MAKKPFQPPKMQVAMMDKVAMSETNYWFTFIADSATVLFFLFWELKVRQAPIVSVITAWLAGYMAWTLTEYCFHRWVYHSIPTIFRAGHEIHHEKPMKLIAMPWFFTTLTMAAVWYFCAVTRNIPLILAVLAGWLVGFIGYSLVHHGLHHWNIQSRWTRRLKAYHRIHHHFPDYNYGVTMGFWDRVFGTTYRKPQTRVNVDTGEDFEMASVGADTAEA
jgi:sterol desaturase/sphingolipid hydroxylase (fatty acid hydroxylase superfamily)